MKPEVMLIFIDLVNPERVKSALPGPYEPPRGSYNHVIYTYANENEMFIDRMLQFCFDFEEHNFPTYKDIRERLLKGYSGDYSKNRAEYYKIISQLTAALAEYEETDDYAKMLENIAKI